MKPVHFRDYKQIQKMTFNQFNRWVEVLYKSGFEDGLNAGQDNVIAEISDDELMEILLSVKGIGRKRAEQVIEKIEKIEV